MSQPPPQTPTEAEQATTLPQTLEAVRHNDDPGPQPKEAVTDCGVAPGHNRLEDREGA